MIRALGRRYPGTTAGLILAGFTAVLTLPYLTSGGQDLTGGTGVVSFDALTGGLVWQALLSMVLLFIIWLLGWDDIAGLRGPTDRRGLRPAFWVGSFPALGFLGFAFALTQIEGSVHPFRIITFTLTLNLMVGVSEELLFRGILFGSLRQGHRLISAIVVSSIAFGLLHLVNLGIGQDLTLTIFQVVNAAALGALFCAICLQANSILPAVILHMFWNSYVMLGQAVADTNVQAGIDNVINTTPTIGPESLLLPTIILLIAIWVFVNYTRRTGHSLWAIVPTPTQPLPIHA